MTHCAVHIVARCTQQIASCAFAIFSAQEFEKSNRPQTGVKQTPALIVIVAGIEYLHSGCWELVAAMDECLVSG